MGIHINRYYQEIEDQLRGEGFEFSQDPNTNGRFYIRKGGESLAVNLDVLKERGVGGLPVYALGSTAGRKQTYVPPVLDRLYNVQNGEVIFSGKSSATELRNRIVASFDKQVRGSRTPQEAFYRINNEGISQASTSGYVFEPLPDIPQRAFGAEVARSATEVMLRDAMSHKSMPMHPNIQQTMNEQLRNAIYGPHQNPQENIPGLGVQWNALRGYAPEVGARNTIWRYGEGNPENADVWLRNEPGKVAKYRRPTGSNPAIPLDRDAQGRLIMRRPEQITGTNTPGYALSNVVAYGEETQRPMPIEHLLFTNVGTPGAFLKYDNPSMPNPATWGYRSTKTTPFSIAPNELFEKPNQLVPHADMFNRTLRGGLGNVSVGQFNGEDISLRLGASSFEPQKLQMALPSYYNPQTNEWAAQNAPGLISTRTQLSRLQEQGISARVLKGGTAPAWEVGGWTVDVGVSAKGGPKGGLSIVPGKQSIQVGDMNLPVTMAGNEWKTSTSLATLGMGSQSLENIRGIFSEWAQAKGTPEALGLSENLPTTQRGAINLGKIAPGGNWEQLATEVYGTVFSPKGLDTAEGRARNLEHLRRYETGWVENAEFSRGPVSPGLLGMFQGYYNEAYLAANPGATTEQASAQFANVFRNQGEGATAQGLAQALTGSLPEGNQTAGFANINQYAQGWSFYMRTLMPMRVEHLGTPRGNQEFLEAASKRFPIFTQAAGLAEEGAPSNRLATAAQAAFAFTSWRGSSLRGETGENFQPQGAINISSQKALEIEDFMRTNKGMRTRPLLEAIQKKFLGGDTSNALMQFEGVPGYIPQPGQMAALTHRDIRGAGSMYRKLLGNLSTLSWDVANQPDMDRGYIDEYARKAAQPLYNYLGKVFTSGGNFMKRITSQELGSQTAGGISGTFSTMDWLNPGELWASPQMLESAAVRMGFSGGGTNRAVRQMQREGLTGILERYPQLTESSIFGATMPSEKEIISRIGKENYQALLANPLTRGQAYVGQAIVGSSEGDFDADYFNFIFNKIRKGSKLQTLPTEELTTPEALLSPELATRVEEEKYKTGQNPFNALRGSFSDLASGKNVFSKLLASAKEYSGFDLWNAAASQKLGKTQAVPRGYNFGRDVAAYTQAAGYPQKVQDILSTSKARMYQAGLENALEGDAATGLPLAHMAETAYFGSSEERGAFLTVKSSTTYERGTRTTRFPNAQGEVEEKTWAPMANVKQELQFNKPGDIYRTIAMMASEASREIPLAKGGSYAATAEEMGAGFALAGENELLQKRLEGVERSEWGPEVARYATERDTEGKFIRPEKQMLGVPFMGTILTRALQNAFSNRGGELGREAGGQEALNLVGRHLGASTLLGSLFRRFKGQNKDIFSAGAFQAAMPYMPPRLQKMFQGILRLPSSGPADEMAQRAFFSTPQQAQEVPTTPRVGGAGIPPVPPATPPASPIAAAPGGQQGDLLFEDIESTGLERWQHIPLSVGLAYQGQGGKLQHQRFYVNPTDEQWAAQTPEAARKHGLTREFLAQRGVPLEQLGGQMATWLKKVGAGPQTTLVGQNIGPSGIDLMMLQDYAGKDLEAAGLNLRKQPIDVMDEAKTLEAMDPTFNPTGFSGEAISNALGVKAERPVHTAIGGVNAVIRNYRAIQTRLNKVLYGAEAPAEPSSSPRSMVNAAGHGTWDEEGIRARRTFKSMTPEQRNELYQEFEANGTKTRAEARLHNLLKGDPDTAAFTPAPDQPEMPTSAGGTDGTGGRGRPPTVPPGPPPSGVGGGPSWGSGPGMSQRQAYATVTKAMSVLENPEGYYSGLHSRIRQSLLGQFQESEREKLSGAKLWELSSKLGYRKSELALSEYQQEILGAVTDEGMVQTARVPGVRNAANLSAEETAKANYLLFTQTPEIAGMHDIAGLMKMAGGRNVNRNMLKYAARMRGEASFTELNQQLQGVYGMGGKEQLAGLREVLGQNPQAADIIQQATTVYGALPPTRRDRWVGPEMTQMAQLGEAAKKLDPDIFKKVGEGFQVAKERGEAFVKMLETHSKISEKLYGQQKDGNEQDLSFMERRQALRTKGQLEEQISGEMRQFRIGALRGQIGQYGATIGAGEATPETYEKLNKAYGELEGIQGAEDAAVAQKKVGAAGRAARRLIGGWGLMYAERILGMATSGLGYGMQERMAGDQQLAQGAYATTGAQAIPYNQANVLRSAQAMYGASNDPRMSLGIFGAQHPLARDTFGAAKAGVATWAYSQFAAEALGAPILGAASVPLGIAAGLGYVGMQTYASMQDPNTPWRIGQGKASIGDWGANFMKYQERERTEAGAQEWGRWTGQVKFSHQFTQAIEGGMSTRDLMKFQAPGYTASPYEHFYGIGQYVRGQYSEYSGEAQTAATQYLMRSGMSPTDERLKGIISDYELTGSWAEKTSRGLLGAMGSFGYETPTGRAAARGEGLTRGGSLQSYLANTQFTAGERARIETGMQTMGQIQGLQFLPGMNQMTNPQTVQYAQQVGALSMNPLAMNAYSSQVNAYMLGQGTGLNFAAPNIANFNAQMTPAEAMRQSAIGNANAAQASNRYQMAQNWLQQFQNLGWGETGMKAYNAFMGQPGQGGGLRPGEQGPVMPGVGMPTLKPGMEPMLNQLLGGNPMALATFAPKLGMDLSQYRLGTIGGGQIGGEYAAFADMTRLDSGRYVASGLNWGQTSWQLGGVSATQMAGRLFGQNWQNNQALSQNAIQAGIGGFQLPGGATIQTPQGPVSQIGGTTGMQLYSNDLQYQHMQKMYGYQMQGIRQDETYLKSLWELQDRQWGLQGQHQQWQFGFQQRQLNLGAQQFYENRELQFKGTQMQRGFTQQDWQYQNQVRGMQWAWQQEDFSEESRFMTGRQRRLAERQQTRATTMHDMETEQIQRKQQQQRQMWKLEDERFALERKHFEQNRKMQQEALDENRKFWEENRKIEEEIRDLQRKHQLEQMELQKKMAEASHEYEVEQLKLHNTMLLNSTALDLIVGQLKTLREDALMPIINDLLEKMPELLPLLEQLLNMNIEPPREPGERRGEQRAIGGPVAAGRSYLVGEYGPELYTPNSSGAIATAAMTSYMNMTQSTDRARANLANIMNMQTIPIAPTSQSAPAPIVNVYIGNERINDHIVRVVEKAIN